MNSSVIEQNDIDLKKFLEALLNNKFWIIGLLSIFVAIGLGVAKSMPNKYTAKVLLASDVSGSSSMGGLSQLTGLAGISLPESKGETKVASAIKLLESNHFIGKFLEYHHYQADVFAVESWIPETNTLTYNEKLFKDGKWIRESTFLKTSKPNAQELTEKFLKDNLSVDHEQKSGFLTLYMTHHSPYIAKEMLDNLILYINSKASMKVISEADEKVAYLNSAIDNTDSSEIKSAFFNMIILEEKEKMLASVKRDYLFKVLDPSMLPSEKSGPKRLLILILFAFIGFFLGCLVACYRSFFSNKSS